ncbi:trypsin CFT-1-like [Melitaea cinxia]|uniref:trypsin CFT-1-like n=1 Tax=Melitaea cinxia TaxID=113334 RepID=UPI001E2737E1|nr:trypsin CFT-1-like [Melitaea cinxia]
MNFRYFGLAYARDVNQDAESYSAAAGDVTRIIGGNVTTVEKYPFAVQILYMSQLCCGGSLITMWHVLTAAHCFFNQYGQLINPALVSARIGSSYANRGGTVHQVSQIVVHDSYNTPIRDNDVAVMTLASSVRLSSSVALAVLPIQDSEVPDNEPVVLIGWGRTNASVAQGSESLKEVEVYSIPRDTCRVRYEFLESYSNQPFPVTENMICVGILNVGGKDACQGDSGGPVLHRGVVVGITSWGWGCAEAQFPGVNTRVSSYTSWINSTVREHIASRSSDIKTTIITPLL